VGVALAIACRMPEPQRVPVPLGLDLFAPIPRDNALSPARVALGKQLFFDPILSSDGRVSCSSCHRPDHAFSDTSASSLGAQQREGRRNAPSLLNAVYRTEFFWDGRAASLEQQALEPIQDSLEMNLRLDDLEARLRARPRYRRAFRREFGVDPTATDIARALASYLRTLRSGDAPIDRFRSGDTSALSPLARQGFQLFIGNAGCAACHVGPLFTDGDFHNTGIAWRGGAFADSGRAAVTGDPDDRGRFKTPSLRNVALTAPYMHDGSKRSLLEVVEFYDSGGRGNPSLDPLVRPLRLNTDQKRALLAFLESLTTERSTGGR
jgi:cytochrome c peroxidase